LAGPYKIVDAAYKPAPERNLDVIGNAYEYLAKNFAAKAGEFYTPPDVTELMAEIVTPKESDEIRDPTCCSACVLLKYANQIRKANDGLKKFGNASNGCEHRAKPKLLSFIL
jgi:type I restriction enzyme M protein